MRPLLCSLVALLALSGLHAADHEVRFQVVDSRTGAPLAARVYAQSSDGQWLFAKSASPDGSAVIYDKQRFETSFEKHTTVSAHPFTISAPSGPLRLRIERGKEYVPEELTVEASEAPSPVRIALRRWIDMAADGWYSGDTHVHRPLEELPNLVMAEDLNVALPLSYWVTTAYTPPVAGKGGLVDVSPVPQYVDSTHVIYPVNAEYEIFQVGHQRHTLGAIFVLGHKTPFPMGVPEVQPVAERARQEGALLDLDKHSWPWSLMLVPVAKVDLFELANNHCWETEFGFRNWTIDAAPDYMRLERDARGLTEWGWIDFGFQTYYALLNSGFRMRPSAGTASGVHPVPLGFGRVYVQVEGDFTYEKWMANLAAGRSFVTTGPMLTVTVNGQPPGSVIQRRDGDSLDYRIRGLAAGVNRLREIELVVNGEVQKRLPAENRARADGGFESPIDVSIAVGGSSWIVVRVFEDRPDRRVRFAHSSPVHIDVPGKPLRPRPEETEYLVRRMEEEIERNQDVLTAGQLDEYRQAQRAFERAASE